MIKLAGNYSRHSRTRAGSQMAPFITASAGQESINLTHIIWEFIYLFVFFFKAKAGYEKMELREY